MLKTKYFQCLPFDQSFTINPELCRMSDGAGSVGGPASVLPDVGEIHTGDDQQAGPRPHHGGAEARTSMEFRPLKAPSDCDGHVAV